MCQQNQLYNNNLGIYQHLVASYQQVCIPIDKTQKGSTTASKTIVLLSFIKYVTTSSKAGQHSKTANFDKNSAKAYFLR